MISGSFNFKPQAWEKFGIPSTWRLSLPWPMLMPALGCHVPGLLENCGIFCLEDSPSHWFWKGVWIYTFELLGLLDCLSLQGSQIHVFKAVWLAAPARCWAKAPVPRRQGPIGPIAPAPLADLFSMQRACFTILSGFLVALGTFSILYSSLGCRHSEGWKHELTLVAEIFLCYPLLASWNPTLDKQLVTCKLVCDKNCSPWMIGWFHHFHLWKMTVPPVEVSSSVRQRCIQGPQGHHGQDLWQRRPCVGPKHGTWSARLCSSTGSTPIGGISTSTIIDSVAESIGTRGESTSWKSSIMQNCGIQSRGWHLSCLFITSQ